MTEGIHLDLDTWIVPGQIRKANLRRGGGEQLKSAKSPPENKTGHLVIWLCRGCFIAWVVDWLVTLPAVSWLVQGGWVVLGGRLTACCCCCVFVSHDGLSLRSVTPALVHRSAWAPRTPSTPYPPSTYPVPPPPPGPAVMQHPAYLPRCPAPRQCVGHVRSGRPTAAGCPAQGRGGGGVRYSRCVWKDGWGRPGKLVLFFANNPAAHASLGAKP